MDPFCLVGSSTSAGSNEFHTSTSSLTAQSSFETIREAFCLQGAKAFLDKDDHNEGAGGSASLVPGALVEVVVIKAKDKRLLRVTTNREAVCGATTTEWKGLTISESSLYLILEVCFKGSVLHTGCCPHWQAVQVFNAHFHIEQALPEKETRWVKCRCLMLPSPQDYMRTYNIAPTAC